MAQDSYIKKDTISGGNINIDEAPSGFTSFLNSAAQGLTQSEGTKQKNEQEKIKYYTTLREAGYSADEASSRVNKMYKGSWLKKVLNKTQGFTAPTNDPFTQKQEKDKAETELVKAKSKYYASGGRSRSLVDKMTPAQLQSRLKYLENSMTDDPSIDDEISHINERLQEIEGFNQNGDAGSAAGTKKTGKYQLGQQVQAGGKTYKVVGLQDPNDPDLEEVTG